MGDFSDGASDHCKTTGHNDECMKIHLPEITMFFLNHLFFSSSTSTPFLDGFESVNSILHIHSVNTHCALMHCFPPIVQLYNGSDSFTNFTFKNNNEMHFSESLGRVAHLAFVVMFIVFNLNSQQQGYRFYFTQFMYSMNFTYIMQFSTMHLHYTVYGLLRTPRLSICINALYTLHAVYELYTLCAI